MKSFALCKVLKALAYAGLLFGLFFFISGMVKGRDIEPIIIGLYLIFATPFTLGFAEIVHAAIKYNQRE